MLKRTPKLVYRVLFLNGAVCGKSETLGHTGDCLRNHMSFIVKTILVSIVNFKSSA